jgi:DNA polymerase III delta prime subunit
MFYIDKYIPKNINDIFFHHDIYKILEVMSTDSSIPHLLFHGPNGSGKKTMVNIFMEMLFGKSIHSVKDVKYIVSGSGNTETEEQFKQSFHHIFIEPKGNNHDRYLIHDVIKVYVSKARYNLVESKHHFKLVVINNVNIMSESVQFSLRRTIEKYSDQCRFIIISNSISKIINPIASRCKCILVKSPSPTEIIDYANYISLKENINLTIDRSAYLLQLYNGNIKNILWRLQMYKLNEIYIEKIKEKLTDIKNLLKHIEVNFDDNYYFSKIKDCEYTNVFIFKNINKFVNDIGNEMFNNLKIILKDTLCKKQYNYYFTNPSDYMVKVQKILNKKIKLEKKNKIDDIICKIGTSMFTILNTIKLLDPLLSKDYTIRELYRYIKTCDLKYINNIRNIIYNLLITNISGTNIIKNYTEIIINDEKIDIKKKLKILDVCREAEYGIIKGRREINQFDNLIVSTINIITN